MASQDGTEGEQDGSADQREDVPDDVETEQPEGANGDESKEESEEEEMPPEEREARTTYKDYSEFIVPKNLTQFQRDILHILYAESSLVGIKLGEAMGELYEEEVNHGRLYPNLDELHKLGLIEKGKIDDRTNRYIITTRGRLIMDEYHKFVNSVQETANEH